RAGPRRDRLVARTRLSAELRGDRNAFANTPSSGPTARRPPRALASEMPHCPLAGGAPVHGCAFHTLVGRAARPPFAFARHPCFRRDDPRTYSSAVGAAGASPPSICWIM